MASDQKGSLASGKSCKMILWFRGCRYVGITSSASFLELGTLSTPYLMPRRCPGSLVMYLMYSQAHVTFCGLAPFTTFRPEPSAPTGCVAVPVGNVSKSRLPCCHSVTGWTG